MLRINIFANGDTRRQNGRVILLDRPQQQQQQQATLAFHNFLVDCAKKLQFTHSQLDGQWVAYTSQGGLIEDLSQLLQNDTLFIARSHEKFKFKYRVLLIGDSGDDEIEELSSSSSSSHLLLSRHMVHHYLSDSQYDDHRTSDHSDDNHSDPMNAPPPPPTTVVTTTTTATTEVVTTGDNQGDESDNDDDDDDESPPAHQQQRNSSSSSLKQHEQQQQQQQQLYTINIKYVRESLLLDQKSNGINGIDEYTFVTDCPEKRSVKSVKKWLSRHRLNGCHINDITLIRNGQALSAEHRVIDLFDSGVNATAAATVAAAADDDDKQQQVQQPTRSCTLFLIIKPMVLYIRQMRGGNATITMNENVSHETLVKDVKSLVLRRTGLSHVKLMFNQRELIDGQKLSAYEVMSGAVIYAC